MLFKQIMLGVSGAVLVAFIAVMAIITIVKGVKGLKRLSLNPVVETEQSNADINFSSLEE